MGDVAPLKWFGCGFGEGSQNGTGGRYSYDDHGWGCCGVTLKREVNETWMDEVEG